jgi:DNA-binding GntR family transcriptional regulator
VPAQARGKEVWSQIIAAVQQAGQVPTQRELADELNVPRSRVRRAIERNRDEWDDLVGRVEDRATQAPVTSGGSRPR